MAHSLSTDLGTVDRNARIELRAALVLAALTLLAYLPALGAQFVWDDDVALLTNPLIHGVHGLFQIWTTTGLIPKESHWWPLLYTALWTEHLLWGWEPAGYHLVNILLHAAVAVQIWRLLRRSMPTAGMTGPWIAAGLFALHPVHVESVAWVVEIKDLLSTLFYLFAVEFFLIAEERRGAGWIAGIALATLAGMLCKSSVVTLPAGLAILIWWRRGRFARREIGLLAVAGIVALGMGALDWSVTRHTGDSLPGDAPALAVRLARSGWAFWFYAGKIVWPNVLSCIYPQWRIDPSRLVVWLPLAAAFAFTVLLWAARKRIGRGPLACWLFYAATLAPTIGVLHFSFLTIAPVADRYQYLASLGPLIGAGVLIGSVLERPSAQARRGVYVCCGLMFLLLGAKTWRQSEIFHDEGTLFRHALTVAPDAEIAYTNLAVGLLREKKWEEARVVLEKSIALRPDSALAYYNLGSVMTAVGDDGRALELYRKALAIEPKNLNVQDSMAWILATTPDAGLRDGKQAERIAKDVVAQSPAGSSKRLGTLAAAEAANGNFGEARRLIAEAESAAMSRGMSGLRGLLERQRRRYDRDTAYIRPAGGAAAEDAQAAKEEAEEKMNGEKIQPSTK